MKSSASLLYIEDLPISPIGNTIFLPGISLTSFLTEQVDPFILLTSVDITPSNVRALQVEGLYSYEILNNELYLIFVEINTSAQSNLSRIKASIITAINDVYGETLWRTI